MALRIDTQGRIEAVRFQNQTGSPAAPAAGYSLLYLTTNGLYMETSGGAVIGPFVTGTAPAPLLSALVLLEQHSATATGSSTLDFTTAITATYDDYQIELIDVVPATNNVDFYLLFSQNGGSSWDEGNNYCNNHYLQATSGNVSAVGATDTTFAVRRNGEISNTSSKGLSGRLSLSNPGGTATLKKLWGNIVWPTATGWVNTMFQGTYLQTAAVNALRFKFSSGNIASGTIRIYGIAKS